MTTTSGTVQSANVLGRSMMKLHEEDVNRHQRAVKAVCDWGVAVDVFITVDDAVNIVSFVLDEWAAINEQEAQRDIVVATERMRKYGRV
jgi:hypothetical protein